jgi:hypothetical protein
VHLFTSGQEDLFRQVGTRVETRTSAPPKLNEKEQAEFHSQGRSTCTKAPR